MELSPVAAKDVPHGVRARAHGAVRPGRVRAAQIARAGARGYCNREVAVANRLAEPCPTMADIVVPAGSNAWPVIEIPGATCPTIISWALLTFSDRIVKPSVAAVVAARPVPEISWLVMSLSPESTPR